MIGTQLLLDCKEERTMSKLTFLIYRNPNKNPGEDFFLETGTRGRGCAC